MSCSIALGGTGWRDLRERRHRQTRARARRLEAGEGVTDFEWFRATACNGVNAVPASRDDRAPERVVASLRMSRVSRGIALGERVCAIFASVGASIRARAQPREGEGVTDFERDDDGVIAAAIACYCRWPASS